MAQIRVSVSTNSTVILALLRLLFLCRNHLSSKDSYFNLIQGFAPLHESLSSKCSSSLLIKDYALTESQVLVSAVTLGPVLL